MELKAEAVVPTCKIEGLEDTDLAHPVIDRILGTIYGNALGTPHISISRGSRSGRHLHASCFKAMRWGLPQSSRARNRSPRNMETARSRSRTTRQRDTRPAGTRATGPTTLIRYTSLSVSEREKELTVVPF